MKITGFLNSRGFYQFEGNVSECHLAMNDLILLTSKPNIKVMEIGFNCGHSAEIILENNKSSTLLSFDLGDHDYVSHGKEYIENVYPGRHSLILGDSKITVKKFVEENPEEKFDVIFIDGGHDYETAKSDMENCLLLSGPNTIIIFDDTCFTQEWQAEWTIGPTTVWNEFLRDKKIIELGRRDYRYGRGMAFGRKET